VCGKIGKEVRPECGITCASHRKSFFYQLAVLPISERIVPRCHAVKHNLIPDSKGFVEAYPLIKIGIIIRKAISVLYPFDHRWIMYILCTVRLSVPGIFDDRSSDRMSACFFIELHGGLHDLQMFIGKRLYVIIFCTRIRILPQFNIKGISVVVRKFCILHTHFILKHQRLIELICCYGQLCFVSAGFCCLWNRKLNPDWLECICFYVDRRTLPENIRCFRTVLFCCRRNIISIYISINISFCRTNKRCRHIFGCDLLFAVRQVRCLNCHICEITTDRT